MRMLRKDKVNNTDSPELSDEPVKENGESRYNIIEQLEKAALEGFGEAELTEDNIETE